MYIVANSLLPKFKVRTRQTSDAFSYTIDFITILASPKYTDYT
jgi:hypothetical protein